MICVYTKFRMPSSCGSLVIIIPKVKYRFHAAAMLFSSEKKIP